MRPRTLTTALLALGFATSHTDFGNWLYDPKPSRAVNSGERQFWPCAVMRHRVIVPLLIGWLSLSLTGCANEDPGCVVGLGAVVVVGALLFGGLNAPTINGDPCKRSSSSAPVNTATNPELVRVANEDRQKAESGDASAQYSLGQDYKYSYGVAQNLQEAANWYARAANQGLAIAQRDLGEAYQHGFGVQQDYVEADKWYLLSEMGGESTAADYRQSIESHMAPAQIAEAKKLASEWEPVGAGATAPPTASITPTTGVSQPIAPPSAGSGSPHPRIGPV